MSLHVFKSLGFDFICLQEVALIPSFVCFQIKSILLNWKHSGYFFSAYLSSCFLVWIILLIILLIPVKNVLSLQLLGSLEYLTQLFDVPIDILDLKKAAETYFVSFLENNLQKSLYSKHFEVFFSCSLNPFLFFCFKLFITFIVGFCQLISFFVRFPNFLLLFFIFFLFSFNLFPLSVRFDNIFLKWQDNHPKMLTICLFLVLIYPDVVQVWLLSLFGLLNFKHAAFNPCIKYLLLTQHVSDLSQAFSELLFLNFSF